MLCICLIGLAAGAEYDLLAFMVARYFGMKSYGGVYGALYSFFALGAGVGPVVFGSNFDRTHAYTESLHLASALFLIPAVALLALGRYRQFTTGAAAAPLVHAGQLAVLLLASAMVFCSLPVRASDQSRGKILFLRCASCHDISETTSAKIGPNLAHVFGRKVASVKGFQYSAALRAQDFNWDTEHLDAWLTNPNAVAPGTIMAFAGLANPADRQAIIAYLRDP
jgi:cytochrome c2